MSGAPPLLRASALDIWSLGIAIVIGGQYFSWNAGLTAGVASNGLALALMGSAYVCLVLSIAEMTSTLPFAGGAYGLSRCCLGYFSGFVIGCCEALEYIAYVSSSVLTLGQMLQIVFPAISDASLPLVWLAIFVLAVAIHVRGGRLFWPLVRALAFVSIGVLLLFCVGSFSSVDFDLYAGSAMIGGADSFFTTMPLAAWFFVGVESLNTLANTIQDPKTVIPRGQIPCVFTLCLTGFAVFFVAVSLPPGAASLHSVVAIFNPGFTLMFGIADDLATLFSIPATFATIFGFILAYANILSALANSKLLPVWVGALHPKYHTQANALIVGSVLSYIFCFCVKYSPTLGKELFNICMFFGFSAYLAQCAGYLYLKREFKHLPRQFKSPVGKPGVYFSAIVWSMNWISIVCCQGNTAYLLSCISTILVLLTLYYYGYAKSRQSISDDERKILLFVHVAKNNSNKSKRSRARASRWGRLKSRLESLVSKVRRSHASSRNSVMTLATSSRDSVRHLHFFSWLAPSKTAPAPMGPPGATTDVAKLDQSMKKPHTVAPTTHELQPLRPAEPTMHVEDIH